MVTHMGTGVFLRGQPHNIAFAQCIARFVRDSGTCFLYNIVDRMPYLYNKIFVVSDLEFLLKV